VLWGFESTLSKKKERNVGGRFDSLKFAVRGKKNRRCSGAPLAGGNGRSAGIKE